MGIVRRLDFSCTAWSFTAWSFPAWSFTMPSFRASAGLNKNKKPVTGGAFHRFACNRLVLRFLIGSNVVVTLVAAG